AAQLVIGGGPISRGAAGGRAILDRRTIHVADYLLEPEAEYPRGRKIARTGGNRAALATPLLRDKVAIGAVMLRRREPGPFTDKQVALVETFADQAVIAIENARL